jgi:nucleotide-binding universal stress UspA family protein
MLTFTRILCPTDFSDVSTKAERFALAIARHYGGRLSLLHVDPPLPAMAYGEFPVEVRLSDAQRRQAESDMMAARRRAQDNGVIVDAEVRGGSPAREILEVAQHASVDLIVLGTHGRGGVEHFLLGSVAEKVLRKARCPVMVVPSTADADRGALFSRILCPIDGSAPSSAAVACALSLARETDAAITLQQVIAPLPVTSDVAALDAAEYERHAEALARTTLHDAVPPDAREWCRIDEEVSVGKASERILAVAEARGADVIVMGVRGRNALDLLAFGSTTNDVVRRARCPVLVVHPRAAEPTGSGVATTAVRV